MTAHSEPGSTDNWLIVMTPARAGRAIQHRQSALVTLRRPLHGCRIAPAAGHDAPCRIRRRLQWYAGFDRLLAKTGTYDGFVFTSTARRRWLHAPSPQFMLTQAVAADLGDSAVGMTSKKTHRRIGETRSNWRCTPARIPVPTALVSYSKPLKRSTCWTVWSPGRKQVPTSGDNIALIGGSPLNPFGASLLQRPLVHPALQDQDRKQQRGGPGVYSRSTPRSLYRADQACSPRSIPSINATTSTTTRSTPMSA